MTQPRLIVPGATHFITRRTLGRTHLFAPDPRVRQIFLYSLAVAAARFGVLVHVLVLLSTHEHLTVTDVLGRLPAFLQFFHRCVAMATKVLHRWDGPVWDHRKTSDVELLTPWAIIEKIAYAIANPVAAGLVMRSHEWPGVTTRVDELGRAVWRVERPEWWFDPENGDWPDAAELTLTLPDSLRALGDHDTVRSLVRAEVDRLEADARANQRAENRAFLGPDRCRKLSPFARARSREPLRACNPAFAVGRGRHDERRVARQRLQHFRRAYREALEVWRRGDRGSPFPFGTWHMREAHAARVETVPLAA